MKKVLVLTVLVLMTTGLFARGFTGYWKSVDDKTGEVKSIVGIYKVNNMLYGRIMAIYENGKFLEDSSNPEILAEKLNGQPPYCGLDIIWDLKKSGNRYNSGKIMDPEDGSVYDCEIWIENGNLVVRGSFLFIGRNQTWLPLNRSADLPADVKLPELTSLSPVLHYK